MPSRGCRVRAARIRGPSGRGSFGIGRVIALDNGLELAFPPRMAEGLENATAAELANIEISASGDGLHWPALDADLYIPSLLRGVFGSRSWMARQLGAAGGKANTRAKAAAARENGRKGGRPRKGVGG